MKGQKLNTILDMLGAVGKEIFYAHIEIIDPQVSLPMMKEGISRRTVHHKSWDINLAWLCVSTSAGFVCDRFKPSNI